LVQIQTADNQVIPALGVIAAQVKVACQSLYSEFGTRKYNSHQEIISFGPCLNPLIYQSYQRFGQSDDLGTKHTAMQNSRYLHWD
jgi:hypothetical protein